MAAVSIEALVSLANTTLNIQAFKDYCPNGLQIQGRAEVSKIVCGVTASQALIEAAIDARAEVLLVHHGFFWRGEDARITGMKYHRIKLLMDHGISLLAYHLPLDAHPELGNNAQLARLLGIGVSGGLEPDNPHSVGNVGELEDGSLAVAAFCSRVEDVLGRTPLLVQAGDHPIRRIAWCTGGAQGYIDDAAALGVDAYLSGEISEATVHSAREQGVHYIAAGHHATERYGVQALAGFLAEQLGISQQYIDIDSPA